MTSKYSMFIPKSYDEIYHNTKIKKYPDGLAKITVASRNIFREPGWELTDTRTFSAAKIPKPQCKDNESRADSKKRAKDSVFDILSLNRERFKFFVTLTFDPDKVNSKSPKEVIKVLRHFLKNMTCRKGLSYLLVPELHRDGKIHIHGFVNDCMELVDSNTRKVKGYDKPLKLETLKRKGIQPQDCKVIYNLPQWKHGFSTVEEISGSNEQVFGYVTKYITKDLSKIFGNFYYAGGIDMRKVPCEYTDTDYESFECDREIYSPEAKTSFKYLKIYN